jgi:uncharacterized protein YjbI with pentapeptide repeats
LLLALDHNPALLRRPAGCDPREAGGIVEIGATVNRVWAERGTNVEGKELIRRYRAGERTFRDADLTGANLRKAKLSGSNLSGACLAKARLERADLRGANLRGAQLYDADLRRADLRGADLRTATLLVATMAGANLAGAQVTDAQLAAAFSLEGAILPDETRYTPETEARLQQASLRAARASLEADKRR